MRVDERGNQKRRRSRDAAFLSGAPGRIRTVDTRFRSVILSLNIENYSEYLEHLPALL